MIIKNGLVVDPALGLSEKMDLAIENGTILKIGKNIDTDQVSNDTEVLDATGLVVAPGLIDTHVHFRDPGFTYKEDLHTGALAAAKGGFTSVICMANTSPVVDSLPVLKDLIALWRKVSGLNIYRGKAQLRLCRVNEFFLCGNGHRRFMRDFCVQHDICLVTSRTC